MERLTIDAIIEKIAAYEPFHAVASDYSMTIKVDAYVPYICGAVHDGHHFRKELWENCLHTEYDRWFEEDPETKNMVRNLPIVIAGCDSRFEYDLNRPTDEAIFETAWGKQLWKHPLSDAQRERSITKHTNFYKVVHALVSAVERRFGACIVFDMHSYNWKRWEREVPTWNLGTTNVDNERFGHVIEAWRKDLEGMALPNDIVSNAAINNTFYGNGYFLKYITAHFNNTLVLATEIAKVYCDELEQIIFPEVIFAVESQLRPLIMQRAETFITEFGNGTAYDG